MGALLIGISALALAATGHVSEPGGPAVTIAAGDGQHTIARDAPDMGGIQTILVLAGIISGCMSIFMIASTFAFNVTLRSRDLGLLRLMGASGWQVRRMVLGEALVIALPAALLGCVLAVLLTPPMLHVLNGTGLTPVPIPNTVSIFPLLLTFGISLVIAILGAFAASRRAAHIAPLAALRESAIDTKQLSAGRWITGIGALAVGALMLALVPQAGEGSTPLAIFGGIGVTLAAALLGQWYTPRLAYALAVPLRPWTSISGRITAASLLVSRRRTSSLIAPILVIVAVVGALTSVLLTTGAAVIADQQAHIRSQLIATSKNGAFADDDIQALRNNSSIQAVYAPASLPLVIVHDSDSYDRQDVVVGQPADYAATHDVSFVQGSTRRLSANEVVVSKEYAGWNKLRIGSHVTLKLFDGRTLKPQVAAIVDAGADTPVLMVSPELARAQVAPPTQAYLTIRSDSSITSVQRGISNDNIQVTSVRESANQADSEQSKLNILVLIVLAGPASLYALIAIANTLVMSYSQRGKELQNMRLLGLQYAQLQRLVLWESIVIFAVGLLIAGIIIAVTLLRYYQALLGMYSSAPTVVAWQALIPLGIAALVVSVVTGLLAVRKMIRMDA